MGPLIQFEEHQKAGVVGVGRGSLVVVSRRKRDIENEPYVYRIFGPGGPHMFDSASESVMIKASGKKGNKESELTLTDVH